MGAIPRKSKQEHIGNHVARDATTRTEAEALNKGVSEHLQTFDSAAGTHTVPRQLQSSSVGCTVPAATPFRQIGRKYMSKRSGQAGQVMLRHDRWVGRYYVDVPGQSKRVRRAVVLGMKQEITKPEAKRKLLDIITQEGVNTPSHLERSLKSPLVFADIANAWEAKRLQS